MTDIFMVEMTLKDVKFVVNDEWCWGSMFGAAEEKHLDTTTGFFQGVLFE